MLLPPPFEYGRGSNNLRFPGQYYDAESGLHYNYNRYYNPNTGRYLTTDPFKDGLNLYLYTFGNPINLYDPLGLASICDLHNALDLLGMVPGFGEIFDLANSLLYLLQGDYGMAALSAGAAIPVAGYLFNAIKGGKKLGKLFKYLKRFNAELGEAGHVVLRHGDDVTRQSDFIADLSKTKARSRAGHKNAGNKQLHDAMKSDPNLRSKIESKYGNDAFDRTSPKGGRKNPQGAEWHHNKNNKNDLELKTKEDHIKTHKDEGKRGGWADFWI